jgi:RNA polymerase primary sigma factor
MLATRTNDRDTRCNEESSAAITRRPEAFAEGAISESRESGPIDGVQWLARQGARFPLLTVEEEATLSERRIEAEKNIALARKALKEFQPSPDTRIAERINDRIKQNEAIRDEVVTTFMERNILLAIKVAGDFDYLPTSLGSRICSAMEGIREAALRYEADRGAKFSTYAAIWIQQRIQRDCRVECRDIRLPHGMGRKIAQLQEAESDLLHNLGRAPNQEELGKALKVSEKTLQLIQRARDTATISIHTPTHENDSASSIADHLPDTSITLPGLQVACPDQLRILKQVLDSLSEREQLVIRGRFGFDTDGVPETLEAIGLRMGVSRERIRQIETDALVKLRRRFASVDCPPNPGKHEFA